VPKGRGGTLKGPEKRGGDDLGGGVVMKGGVTFTMSGREAPGRSDIDLARRVVCEGGMRELSRTCVSPEMLRNEGRRENAIGQSSVRPKASSAGCARLHRSYGRRIYYKGC